ncbi:MAG: hypothetical protein ACI4JB_01020 [Porcipelethomonas sp.]
MDFNNGDSYHRYNSTKIDDNSGGGGSGCGCGGNYLKYSTIAAVIGLAFCNDYPNCFLTKPIMYISFAILFINLLICFCGH